jgi:hypothetical protein
MRKSESEGKKRDEGTEGKGTKRERKQQEKSGSGSQKRNDELRRVFSGDSLVGEFL